MSTLLPESLRPCPEPRVSVPHALDSQFGSTPTGVSGDTPTGPHSPPALLPFALPVGLGSLEEVVSGVLPDPSFPVPTLVPV